MVKAQSRNIRSRAVDWLLQSLVSIVNNESASIPITLSVGGLLIAGEMIGGKTYFNEFARQFKAGLGEISKQTAGIIEESFIRLGDVYDRIPQAAQGHPSVPAPRLIHLRKAQTYPAGGNPIPSDEGALWRGRLEAVDGFSLGRLSLR